ncbi:MAG: aminotransferase class I/II-fold pyridoxal phosphate-dependent enzyme, partial [Thermodesulfovibrionales bacterium]
VAQMGISRTPIREAMSILSQEGLVNVRPKRGSFVFETSLEDLAAIAAEHDFYIVSDEIYEKLVYDGVSHVSIASIGEDAKRRTLVVNGLSKSHAMTGWRIGYAAGPADVVKAMANIQSQSTSNPTSIAQAAAVEALRGPQDFIETMLAEFDKRRTWLVGELNALKGVSCATPAGAFYAFPNVSALLGRSYRGKTVSDSATLAAILLEEAHVALVPGSAFGAEGFLRMSYATSMSNIEKGVQRLKGIIEKLS